MRDQPTGRRRLLQAGLAYAVVLLLLVALGLSPKAVEAAVPTYLARYRPGGRRQEPAMGH